MIRATKIKHYVKSMEKRGFSAATLLHDTQVRIEQLDDPGYLVDFWQCHQLIANMLKSTKRQDLAFEICDDIGISDLGILGYAMLSCKTAREAVKLWIHYSHSLVGTLLKVTLKENNDDWRISFEDAVPGFNTPVFCIEELLLFAVRLGSKITGQPIQAKSLELVYAAPEHQHRYEETFLCDITFGGQKNEITVVSPSLDMPLATNDEELHAVCLKHCDTVIRDVTSHSVLATRIRTLLLQRKGEIPTLDDIASTLHLSPRTLKRHLQQEGLTYQILVNQFRNDIAQEYLVNTSLSTREIGYLLGYKEDSSFRRAFKSWNGIAINEYRQTITERKKTGPPPG